VNVAGSGSVVADFRLDVQKLQENVVVRGEVPLTVLDTERATTEIQRTPGGVEVVPATAFKNGPADTIKDVLGWVPGVFTSESRYGADARVSIRGSGLSRPYGNRGVNMYMDGIPINTSDGLVDLFEIDPTAYQYVEVFKGADAMRYGANSLGGAIDFVTPTGRDASGFDGRVDVGSFGSAKSQVSAGGASGRLDYFITGSGERFDGFRDHSNGDQERASGNVGYRFSSKAETRFYVNVNSIRDHMPGELDKTTALTSPTAASSDFTWKDQQRNLDSNRLAIKTTLRFDAATALDFGIYHVYRHVDHPNYLYLDYTVHDSGGFVRATDDRTIGGDRNSLVAGVNFIEGTLDSKSYAYANTFPFGAYPGSAIPGASPGAVKGALMIATNDQPKTTSVYVDDSLYLLPNVAFVVGTQFDRAVRARQDLLTASNSFSLTYDNVTPKVGLLWDLDRASQVFANVSRSAEAPTYDVNTTLTATPLQAQTATTFEVGTRGRVKDATWDISLYHAQIRNELQCVSTYPGSCTYVNANRTAHQGLEAGGGVDFLKSVFTNGDRFRFNATYTFNDFTYDGDPVYGNNRLAGVPAHLIRSEVLFNHPNGLYAGPNIEWMPTAYFADNANTTTVDSYTVVNARVGYDKPTARWSIYVEGRNLADTHYIAVVDVAGNANAAAQIFYPGTGRSIRIGLRVKR
jgi:iron complex outermembrane receptor protein